MSNTPGFNLVDQISGTSLRPIRVASDVFEQRKLNIAEYRISLYRSGNSYFVTFTDIDADVGVSIRGQPGRRPAFEVELDARSLVVLQSNFIR